MNAHLFATGSFLATPVAKTTRKNIAIAPQLTLVILFRILNRRESGSLVSLWMIAQLLLSKSPYGLLQ
ncbi:hypothetical protein Y032_0080g1314 [Ancylostoma ceylanicum]|uniref:Uncharacterized protein n=1 Tax=Ancylostoma ceylanicum TaxID=53326 RepID=A0A016TSF7_9BILA|nr:hypothetical protein Y032_0080g1314 [Ancylostoma ceylanicum]